MVNIDHELKSATCDECGRTQELSRNRSPEDFTIAAVTFQKTHRCETRKKIVTKQPSQDLDRWQQLFHGIYV